jgi:ubiquinone/menaquinone biosynthesis C-methylase UbiE
MQKKARVNIAALGLKNKATLKIMNAENLSFKDKSFDTVVSVNFIHHASDPLKCVREMARVTRRGLVIADINKKGERIMEKVHKMEGQTHPRAKVSMIAMKELLEWLGLDVRSYRDTCQTVLVAEKGEKI